MPRKIEWNKGRALELRARGYGYADIAKAVGMNYNTVAWWFKYGSDGPHETPGKRGKSNRGTPPKARAETADKPAEWDDERRLALVECARSAVERTGFSLGACAVELSRLLAEGRGSDEE